MKNILLLFCWTAIVLPLSAQNIRPVQFSWGTEILPANFETFQQQGKVPEAELIQGKYPRYVQFANTLSTSQRAQTRALGIDIAGYVYPATYLLLLPQDLDAAAFTRLSPTSIVPLKPEWKMAKSLRELPYGAWAVHGPWIDVNLQVFPGISIPDGAQKCRENGMKVLKEGTQNGFIQVRLLRTDLSAAAALPFIQYLELIPPPGEKEDTRGRALHRANLLDSDSPMGKKFNGAGVRTLVRDDGQIGPHIDFQGRLFNRTNVPPIFGASGIEGIHGDGVTGILAGAGNLNPGIKGMAAGADIFAIQYINDFQDETLPLHLNEGITLTNSSYSDGCNTGYTLASQTVDLQIFEHEKLMHVFSAGNINPKDCFYGAGSNWGNITGGHKMAKNALVVANITPDGSIFFNSSRGPAHDGRLKPDISANGANQFSTYPNNGYQEFGGTSGATPGIVGCLAQLTQAFENQHSGAEPDAALLKAAILNTANDLGNPGPDFIFGWGHINAWRALQLLEQNRYLKAQADQGTVSNHTVQVPANLKEMRLMIVWADPPAIPGASKALLNDLDLRILGPDGTTLYLPWKLNSAPNAVTLDAPAGNGRDSLNNVEQVAITNPAAGAYTVAVQGTDVPLGPQSYYLVWAFITDDIQLTYPSGGEGFAPGETERIYWDAYGSTNDFTLEYSTDNGASFTPIATVAANKRFYDWTVPNTISGQVRLLLTRDAAKDTTDYPFSIVPVPSNLAIERVCPDSMTVRWSEVQDSLSYDVYLLGARYMEIAASVDTNRCTIPIANAGQPQWVSVRSSHANGLQGRRAIAIPWPGGLKNCPLAADLGVRTLLAPAGDQVASCSAGAQPVTVRLTNEGTQAIAGAILHYQADNQAIVTEPAPTIPPGATLDFTFQTPIVSYSSNVLQLKVWAEYAADLAHFNDTVAVELPVAIPVVSGIFREDFEAAQQLPPGWQVGNSDGWITWQLTDANRFVVTGSDGNPTRACFLEHYNYNENQAAQDHLYLAPVDLSGVAHPVLGFDLSHRRYGSLADGLRVEIFPNCLIGNNPEILYEKYDPDLATGPASNSFFIPASVDEWRREYVDLAEYAGQSVVIRFVSINNYGNNTFLDNIGIEAYQGPAPAVAEIVTALDSVCRQDTAYFSALQLTPNTQYTWDFGVNSVPATATGPGPHAVYQPFAGTKTITLMAVNALGADTATQLLTVLPFPIPNFTQTASALTVAFTNTSQNAAAYLWDFGDGLNSTEENPTHTYAAPGNYSVKLYTTNPCKTNNKTVNIVLTSGVVEVADVFSVEVLPNPTAGDFVVQINSILGDDLRLNLLDAQGKRIKTIAQTAPPGLSAIPFEGLHLPKGVYQLHVTTRSGTATFRVAVQ